LLRKKATRRALLIAVEEGGGASPELIPGARSEEQDECDGMATVVGGRFLTVKVMPDLVSHHGGAEATNGDDGCGEGSWVIVVRRLGSQSSNTPLWLFAPSSCIVPVLAKDTKVEDKHQ
jgi:hypothetical protein